MPNPVILLTNPGLDRVPREGQYPGGPLTPVAGGVIITGTAWAIHPATSIQDGSGTTQHITYSIDGGAAQNVTLTSPANTPNPSFTITINQANTGGAAGAKMGHTVAITAYDNDGGSTTANLTVLRSS